MTESIFLALTVETGWDVKESKIPINIHHIESITPINDLGDNVGPKKASVKMLSGKSYVPKESYDYIVGSLAKKGLLINPEIYEESTQD